MMHDREPVEPRAGTKRNASEQSTHRTQRWVRVTQALDRVRQAARAICRQTLKVRTVCLMWRWYLCGAQVQRSLSTEQIGIPGAT